LLDRIALLARFKNAKDNSLRQRATRSGSDVREKLRNAWLRLDFLVHLFLKRAHLIGRSSLLGNKDAAGKTAVAYRQKRARQMGEEKPETKNTDDENRHRQVGAIKEFVESNTVPFDHTFDEITGPFFHSRLFVPGSAFTQNARAHQWSQGQRDKTGRENRHNDRD